jgi:Tfp pilus assembly protein PilV
MVMSHRTGAGDRGSQRGFSLVEAMVAGVILTILMIGGFQFIITLSGASIALDRRTEINNIMVLAGTQIQRTDMFQILRTCQQEASANVSRCVTKDRKSLLSNLERHEAPSIAANWRTPLSWAGEVTNAAEGKICIELQNCEQLISNQLVEVQLRVWWAQDGVFKPLPFRFRRGMW